MQVNGPTHVHGAQPINAPHRIHNTPAATTTGYVGGADQLDISHEADLISRIRDLPDIRTDRVAQLRAAIASGNYETADKLDLAVERLLEEIA
ncbi:MAG: flagellar biosynthesis anti-sigma factor FlgM [Pirellulaceae bacterium]|nr:flagellar biosynthesis anti-sigma factor FlgM [Pirellulaceae bacterium]